MTLHEKIISLVPDIEREWYGCEAGVTHDRPITLADVLRAITLSEQKVYVTLGTKYLPQLEMIWDNLDAEIGREYWILSKDLDGQSDLTKRFISNILGV